jgi:hypothetical protein
VRGPYGDGPEGQARALNTPYILARFPTASRLQESYQVCGGSPAHRDKVGGIDTAEASLAILFSFTNREDAVG